MLHLGLDSQGLLNLIVALEADFSIAINDSQLKIEDVQTIRGLSSLVVRLLSKKGGAR